MSDRCARCWARGNGNCEVCNYPGPRFGGEDTYPTPHPIPDVRILDHKTSEYEARRAASKAFRPGHHPADMTKRERHARRLIASATTPEALVHYMGVYARAIPE